MPDKPIIFSGAMVRANIEGRKRQTRRVTDLKRLRWAKGDRLWVRETCRAQELDSGQDGVLYAADEAFIPIENTPDAAGEWLKLASYRQAGTRMKLPLPVPSIHMPRWCSRLTLLVTDVRVERLQDISEAAVLAEGIDPLDSEFASSLDRFERTEGGGGRCVEAHEVRTRRPAFKRLWESIHGPDAWDANPWVAVISYDLVRQNIDRAHA